MQKDRTRIYHKAMDKLLGPHWGKEPVKVIDLIGLDPIYRKTVINLAPPLGKNTQVLEQIEGVVGAKVVRLVSENRIYDGMTVDIPQLLGYLERNGYDDYLHKLEIIQGRFSSGRVIFKIKARPSYAEIRFSPTEGSEGRPGFSSTKEEIDFFRKVSKKN